MSDRLRVRYQRTDAKVYELLDVLESGEGCVPVALAAASGRTLGEVSDVIGELSHVSRAMVDDSCRQPRTRHRGRFPDNFLSDSVDDLHGLPPGLYLVDGTVHLAVVEITESAVMVAEPHSVIAKERAP